MTTLFWTLSRIHLSATKCGVLESPTWQNSPTTTAATRAVLTRSPPPQRMTCIVQYSTGVQNQSSQYTTVVLISHLPQLSPRHPTLGADVHRTNTWTTKHGIKYQIVGTNTVLDWYELRPPPFYNLYAFHTFQ